MNKQHVQVPSMDLSSKGLKHNDPYVYACIKKYMNNTTKSCYPSMSTLEKVSGFKRKRLESSIERLESAGYLTVNRQFGHSNEYVFNDYQKFEIFSYDFLEDTRLTSKEKAYIVATQQYMFKNIELNQGFMSFSAEELGNKIGLSRPTLMSLEKSLQSKNVLSLVPLQSKDSETGLSQYLRVYNFEEFLNLIALKFQQTDDKIQDLEGKYEDLKKKYEIVSKQLEIIMKKNKEDVEIVL